VTNEQTYQACDVVEEYAGLSHLQKSEQTILNLVKHRLSEMDMLDIGVGGGRTTLHFARLVKRYVGIDCSDAMVQACCRRFAGWPGHISFVMADVRNLWPFPSGSFDFVLFSFNGLDYMSHDDRLTALAEIRRVGKLGGLFGFSSHNLQALPRHFSVRRCVSRNPRKAWEKFRFWVRLRRANPDLSRGGLLRQPYGIFNDGAHDFRLETYYIRPAEQIRQLDTHFKDINLFMNSAGGQRIEDERILNATSDPWIYYLCSMK
jgi:ubiquinone/menaquinone biosynthesis C-methylase UbiE